MSTHAMLRMSWARKVKNRPMSCGFGVDTWTCSVPNFVVWLVEGNRKGGRKKKGDGKWSFGGNGKRVTKIPARNQTWNPWRTWLILFHLSYWDKRRFQPVCSTTYPFCFHRLHLKPTLLTVASSHSIQFAVSLFCLFLWFTFFAVWLLSCAAPSASRCEDHRRKHLWWWAHSAESAVGLWREAWQVCSAVKSPLLPFVRSCPFYFCLS